MMNSRAFALVQGMKTQNIDDGYVMVLVLLMSGIVQFELRIRELEFVLHFRLKIGKFVCGAIVNFQKKLCFFGLTLCTLLRREKTRHPQYLDCLRCIER